MSASPPSARGSARRSRRATRIVPWAWAVLVLLFVQNVLGIYLNLFVPLPEGPSLDSLMASYSVLAAHVIVGILLLVAPGIVLYLAARARRADLWAPALATLAFAFLAFMSGIEFVIGGQDDALSFLMELGFLGVVASDVLVLYQATRDAGGNEAARGAAARE